MTKFLLIFILLYSSLIFGQETTNIDSLQFSIQRFNDSITNIIEKYEEDEVDFVAIRSTINYGPNCFFYTKKDSCTRMYILYYETDKLIGRIQVGKIESRSPGDKPSCYDDIDFIYYNLTHYEDEYFTNKNPDFAQYDPKKIIFLGKVNGRYLNESVDRDYFSTFHSGMFYDTFSSRY